MDAQALLVCEGHDAAAGAIPICVTYPDTQDQMVAFGPGFSWEQSLVLWPCSYQVCVDVPGSDVTKGYQWSHASV